MNLSKKMRKRRNIEFAYTYIHTQTHTKAYTKYAFICNDIHYTYLNIYMYVNMNIYINLGEDMNLQRVPKH